LNGIDRNLKLEYSLVFLLCIDRYGNVETILFINKDGISKNIASHLYGYAATLFLLLMDQ
jgi:hypothetical protein